MLRPEETLGAPDEAGEALAGETGFWTETLRVLVVEDNPGDAELLCTMLEGGAAEHHHVAKLADAIECLRHETFHAAILDLSLPDAERTEGLARLRAATDQLPVVVMTGQDDDELAFEAVRDGAYAYLVKGEANTRLLTRTLRYAVERWRVLRELESTRARERHLATHDTLTSLPNRALFLDRLEQAVSSAPRSGRRLGVLFLDLDRFKTVNDTLGHSAGDDLLRAVAERVERTIRRSDTAARLSGDEFAVLATNLPREGDAETVAVKLLETLAEPVAVAGRRHVPAGSIGIATYPSDGEDAGTLLRAADMAMYRAKHSGRGRYVRYSRELSAETRERMEVEQELRGPGLTSALVLAYQPQVDARGGRTSGAEALVRWDNPRLGRLSPDRFVPVAEQIGLIDAIGRWVLDTACGEARGWQGAGPCGISVNVSPRQLDDGSLVPAVHQTLETTGLPARALTLELTESGFLQHGGPAVAHLFELQALGVRLALDDFGTGYASLGQLKSLPVDQLKIDRTFVAGLPEDPANVSIVSAIIELARGLGLETVAEGVETEAQRDYLCERGCDVLQGYLFGKPMEPEAFRAELLRSGEDDAGTA